jgi:hypothetical protein
MGADSHGFRACAAVVVLFAAALSFHVSGTTARAQDASAIIELLKPADGLPPPQRLGYRAAVLRNTQAVIPDVVIVPGPLEAAEAISNWQGIVRYPVLIDDGSDRAAEDIARFVRAFNPRRVVRWDPEVEPWPVDRREQAVRIIRTLGRALETPAEDGDQTTIVTGMKVVGFPPVGAVVVDPADPVWVAGLALAAGRVQAMTFVRGTGRVSATIGGGTSDELAETIGEQLDALGLSWRRLGDDIDAVTLVLNAATKVNDAGYQADNTQTAITDRVIRADAPGGDRWAWAGMIFGSPAAALYRSMCGLFLTVDSAWLFDAYEAGQPWDAFDLTRTGLVLDEADIRNTVFDLPGNNLDDWRSATARGLTDDFVMVNTKGTPNRFDFPRGEGRSGDTPLLHTPAVGIMVHSWSLASPDNERTIAGRWLRNGAYAWFGSVQEPFLQSFLPSPLVVANLVTGMPLGAAVRIEGQPGWKLNLMGDPLITISRPVPAGRRGEIELPIEGVTEIENEMRTALRERRFADGLRALTMLGRDRDVARLARSLLKDRPEQITGRTASLAILPMFRAGEFETLPQVYIRQDGAGSANEMRRDALWHSVRTRPPHELGPVVEQLLAQSLRRGQEIYDALELSEIVRRTSGPKDAADYLGMLADRTANVQHRDQLRRWSNEYLEGRR